MQLFEGGSRILATEDEDVAAAVRMAFRESGIVVRENFGSIEFFEKTPNGVRMTFSKNGNRESAEATLAVVAVGWVADTAGLNLAAVGVEADHPVIVFRTTRRERRRGHGHCFAAPFQLPRWLGAQLCAPVW